jgi:hypothetical protein
MPGPLLTFAQGELDRLAAARAALLPVVAKSSKTLSSANDAYTKAADAFTTSGKAIAAIRRDLSAPRLLDADVKKLADDLRAALISFRADRLVLLLADETLHAAERDQARQTTALAGMEVSLAAARHAVKEAEDREKSQADLKAAAGLPPLSTLAAAVDEALVGEPLADARARVESDLPEKLRIRAKARWTQQNERLDRTRDAASEAEDRLDARRAAEFGKLGAVDAPARALRRAEEDLLAYTATAKARLDSANAAIAAVAHAPAITAAEAAALNDAALKAAREKAVDLEETRDAALVDLELKARDLEKKGLEILSTDPDAKLEDDPDYTELQDERDDLKTKFDDAEAAYTKAARDTLEAWEADVPDHAWDDFARYLQARATLDALKATDADKLGDEIDKAATDLAEALAARLKAQRSIEFVREGADALRLGWLATGKIQDRRLASVVRGDGAS